ncbi:MAG: hypothetical protein KAR42_18130 [candidate division Zixibacteria bacterium]|nr:hypothetical protein [candidate division Zixibacteria bacterium]
MTKKELSNEIKEAFEDVPFPGNNPEDIGVAICHFYSEDMEGFLGKKWSQIDAEFIRDGRDSAIQVMTDKALRYYLPGYLLASLEDQIGLFGDCVLAVLNPWADSDINHLEDDVSCFYNCFDALNNKQKRAICDYLLYMLENGDIDSTRCVPLTLKNYWLKYKGAE